MRAFDSTTGRLVEVPEDQFPDLFAAGKIGLPAGSTIHVEGENGIESIPIEQATERLAKPGVTVVSPERAAEAQLQKEHGGALEQAKAGLEGVASGATLGLSDVLEGETLGNKGEIEARRKANPWTAGVGQLAGAILPSVFTGGEAELAEGAGLGARALEGGADLAGAVGAPTRGLASAGGAVEDAIRTGLGASEKDSLVSALAKQVAAKGAGAAVEGAGYGAAQHLDEQYLGDPNAAGESLLAAAGHGALLGFGTGAVLGAGGELGRAVYGRLAPHLSSLAESQVLRHISPGVGRELEALPGGARAAARRVLDDEAIGIGDTVEQSAPKIAKAAQAADDRIGELIDTASKAGAKGPEVETLLAKVKRDPAAVAAVEAVSGVPSVEAAAREGIDRDAKLFGATLSLADARNLSRVPALRGLIESEVDDAAERAARKLGGGFLDDYRDAKLAADQYAIIQSAVEKRLAKGAEGGIGLGTLAAAAGLLSHGIAGGAGGLALGLVKKAAAERGASTAAVILDRLASLQGIERAVRSTETQLGRGLSGVIPGAERAPVRVRRVVHAPGADSYQERVAAVQKAAANPDMAAKLATADIDSHAPNIARGFQSAAVRATNYLAGLIPKGRHAPSITPQFDRPYQPSPSEKATFNRAFDVAHDPMTVLAAARDGRLTRDHVKALATIYPALYARVVQESQTRLADLRHPLSSAQKSMIDTMLMRGESHDATRMFQQTYANLGPKPPPNPQMKQHENRENPAKRPITSPARNTALDVGRPIGS